MRQTDGTPRSSYRILTTALFCILALQRVASAQVITGRVTTADSTTPLSAVIVEAIRADGGTTRALTNTRGQFSLKPAVGGTYRLTVLRIGYRPTRGPSLVVQQGDTARVLIVAGRDAIALPAITVNERGTCRVNADTGLLVTRVWEEARKAMLSSQLASDGAPLTAEWIEYERSLDSTSRIVRQQRVRSASHPTTHAFRSASPGVLHERGYVVLDATGLTYYAPDADVLLSELFLADHCFRLVKAPESQSKSVGLAFAPARSRRDMREVEGTFWIDVATSELRSLDFTYTNLPEPSAEADPGGRVEFLRLSTGDWLISRWHIRMPRIAVRGLSSADGMRQTLQSTSRSYLQAVQVSGGEVIRAQRGDSLLYRATGESIEVQLRSEDSTVSLSGTTLSLEGTNYSAVADSGGRIRLAPVLTGRYLASLRTPLMVSLGVPPVQRDLRTTASQAVDTILIPPVRQAVARACPRGSLKDDEGLLHGRVRNERGEAIADAIVTVAWTGTVTLMTTKSSASVSARQKTLSGRSDSFGYWRVCGVPRDQSLSVMVATDTLSATETVDLDRNSVASIDLVLRRRPRGSGVSPSEGAGAPRALEQVSR